jgi:hypothetical protein
MSIDPGLDELELASQKMRALMLQELINNRKKGDRPGWRAMQPMALVLEIFHHAAKLHAAVIQENDDLIKEYAADVANMSMMVIDRCNLLGMSIIDPGKKYTNVEWTDAVLKKEDNA